MCTQCHMLANKSLLPRAADYIQNYFLNCTWISLPTLQTLSQQSGLKRKGCWINIYLAIRHRRNHMAGYLCAKSFQYFSPSLSELQQQQKFWKHNIKPSESVTWESLSIAKGNSSTKQSMISKRQWNTLYSWQENHLISSQLIATGYMLPSLHMNLVCLKSHLCNLVTNLLFTVVYSTGFFVTKKVGVEGTGTGVSACAISRVGFDIICNDWIQMEIPNLSTQDI